MSLGCENIARTDMHTGQATVRIDWVKHICGERGEPEQIMHYWWLTALPRVNQCIFASCFVSQGAYGIAQPA